MTNINRTQHYRDCTVFYSSSSQGKPEKFNLSKISEAQAFLKTASHEGIATMKDPHLNKTNPFELAKTSIALHETCKLTDQGHLSVSTPTGERVTLLQPDHFQQHTIHGLEIKTQDSTRIIPTVKYWHAVSLTVCGPRVYASVAMTNNCNFTYMYHYNLEQPEKGLEIINNSAIKYNNVLMKLGNGKLLTSMRDAQNDGEIISLDSDPNPAPSTPCFLSSQKYSSIRLPRQETHGPERFLTTYYSQSEILVDPLNPLGQGKTIRIPLGTSIMLPVGDNHVAVRQYDYYGHGKPMGDMTVVPIPAVEPTKASQLTEVDPIHETIWGQLLTSSPT